MNSKDAAWHALKSKKSNQCRQENQVLQFEESVHSAIVRDQYRTTFFRRWDGRNGLTINKVSSGV